MRALSDAALIGLLGNFSVVVVFTLMRTVGWLGVDGSTAGVATLVAGGLVAGDSALAESFAGSVGSDFAESCASSSPQPPDLSGLGGLSPVFDVASFAGLLSSLADLSAAFWAGCVPLSVLDFDFDGPVVVFGAVRTGEAG